jgi:hypothetical protein
MPRGRTNLQEMETGTKQSRTAVNAGAKAAMPMQHLTTGIPDGQKATGWEDLGGPTPENYRSTDDSAKFKDPAAILSQVRDVVNRGAKAAEAMQKMKEELDDEYDEVIEEGSCEDDSEDEDYKEDDSKEDDSKMEKGKKKPKSKRAPKDDKEDEDEEKSPMKEELEEIESQIEEDVDALLSGEELSEEFKFKARTVFEAALNARTEQIEEAIVHQYEQQLVEEIEVIAEALTERVDAYLEYVADEWLKENVLAVDQGLRTEFTESFLVNLKSLFEDHYVSIPDEKYDVLESMVEKLDEMETKLNEQIENNVALNQRLAESVTDVIIGEVSEGLALSQKDKLASLAENVEFDSEDNFREKLVTIREAYFSGKAVTPRSTQDYLVEDVTENIPYNTPSGTMGIYLNALERVSKK